MRKQSTVYVVGDQSSVCGMIANLVAPIQASGIPEMCLCVCLRVKIKQLLTVVGQWSFSKMTSS